MANVVHHYLLCYDISDPNRLARVHRIAMDYGRPLQYSVFLVTTSEKGIEKIARDLRREIDAQQDDIRIYPLEDDAVIRTLGKHPIDMAEIHFIDATDPLRFEKLETDV